MPVRGPSLRSRIQKVERALSQLNGKDHKLAVRSLREYRDLLLLLETWNIGGGKVKKKS